MPTSTPEQRAAQRPTSVRTTTERRNVRGEATRQRILAAGERLFAERGISAVPLRDIGIAAGQRNHAAVQYHFGDRDEIVRAIMDYRGAASEKVRAEMIAGFILAETKPTVDEVVGAFVRPLAIHFHPDNYYLPFLSLYVSEEGGYEGLTDVHVGASVVQLRSLLARLAPQIPEPVLDERWWVTLTSTVHALGRYHTAQRKRHTLPAGIDALVADLIAMLSAAILAPTSEQDPRAPRSLARA